MGRFALVALLALSAACGDDGPEPDGFGGPGSYGEPGTDTEPVEADPCDVDQSAPCLRQYQMILGCCQDEFGDVAAMRMCAGYEAASDAARAHADACWLAETGDGWMDDDVSRGCLESADVCTL